MWEWTKILSPHAIISVDKKEKLAEINVIEIILENVEIILILQPWFFDANEINKRY